MAADLAAGEPGRRLLAGGLAARHVRLRPDRVPDDDRRRLGGRLPQQLLPHRRGARRGRYAVAAARRAVGARRPGDRDPRARGSTSTTRWSRGWTAGCAGPAPDEWTDRADVFVRTSTVPEPDLELHEGYWVSGPWPPAGRPRRGVRLDGPRSLAVEAGHRRLGVDRLRRPPAVGALRRPARGRRALAHLGVGRASRSVVGQPRVRLRLSAAAPAASLSVKLCDVFPDGTSALISRGSLDLAFRDVVPRPCRWCPARSTTSRCCSTPAPTGRTPATGSACRWPAPTGRTPSPRPAPVTLTVHAGSLELPAVGRLRDRAAGVRARRRPLRPRTRPTSPGRSRATCSGAPRPARTAPSRPTTCRTTAPRWRTTAARSAWTAAPSPSGRRAETTYRLTWPRRSTSGWSRPSGRHRPGRLRRGHRGRGLRRRGAGRPPGVAGDVSALGGIVRHVLVVENRVRTTKT